MSFTEHEIDIARAYAESGPINSVGQLARAVLREAEAERDGLEAVAKRCADAEMYERAAREKAEAEVGRLREAARAACDRWWEHELQDGEGQRLMRTLGDICASTGR